ncbi:MAG: response regulator [Rhodospirillales bacterium]
MGARILIVEDEILVAMELEFILREAGHDVAGIAADTSSVGRLAAPDIDLALVDLNLRDGVTGPVIGEALVREHGVSVVFLTANPGLLGKGVAGTYGVLSKPYDETAVRRTVDYALLRRTGATPPPPPGLRPFA